MVRESLKPIPAIHLVGKPPLSINKSSSQKNHPQNGFSKRITISNFSLVPK